MEKRRLVQFLEAVDAELAKHAEEGQRLDLYLIGRSALIVRYGLKLATKDVDLVRGGITPDLEVKAFEQFGEGRPQALSWGLYLEAVAEGFPPIPGGYRRRSVELPGNWKVLRPRYPEPHDLAVTKLKRFHAKDREDLRILCDSGDLTSEGLQQALDSAYLWAADEEEDPGRRRAYKNLRTVIDYLEGRRNDL